MAERGNSVRSPLRKWLGIGVLLAGVLLFSYLSGRSFQYQPSSCGCGSHSAQVEPSEPTDKTPAQGVDENAAGKAGTPRLVDLGSDTCVPCKMMKPVLEELTAEYKGNLSVDFVNVSKNRDAVGKYKIRAIPTQIFFDREGKEFFRHQGFYSKDEILAKFKEHGLGMSRGG